MAITAKQVKELREMTGAGMMDCKKALTATEGDFDKAIEFLREKGLATAEKKAGRVAAEGLVKVIVSDDKKKAVAVEVNAETDFVAKNEKFQAYVAQVAEQAMETEAADIDAFLAETWKFDETKTVNEALAGQIAIIGENMNIRRFQQVKEDAGFVASYTHMGGKIGVLVDVATDVVNADIEEMAKNVCMQVAALNPKYTDRSEVDQDYLAKEEEIPIEAFEDAPFIITEYTPGIDVHRILKKHKIHPDIRYVTRNEFSSLSMVEHELGYSILPGLLLRGQQGKFVKRPLKPTITRQLGLAYSSLKNLSPASKTFLEYAKDFLLDD